MSQPFTFQAANSRSPLRIGQIVFTALALLAFACGSVLLSLLWFGVGVTITGKVPGAEPELRGFVFIIVWPVTMLAVWVCSTIALLLAERWVLASLSLPSAIDILMAISSLGACYMRNTAGV